MLTLSIQLKDFAAAHRLILGYKGKCASLHGHNYTVRIQIFAKKLNGSGFIIDITQVKRLLNDWINKHLDHGVLVSQTDKTLLTFLTEEKQKFYLIPKTENTTLEYLSKHLYQVFSDLLIPHDIEIRAVTLFENQTACVTYEHH